MVSLGAQAGLSLDAALALAAASVEDHELVEAIRASLAVDGRQADPTCQEGVDHLRAAWRLTEDLGAPVASTTAAAASALRERAAASERVAVAASGPRTSMWLLTGLPMVGPVVGLALGLSPTELYASGLGGLAAILGLALTGAGWLWSRRLLAKAARPTLVGLGRVRGPGSSPGSSQVRDPLVPSRGPRGADGGPSG